MAGIPMGRLIRHTDVRRIAISGRLPDKKDVQAALDHALTEPSAEHTQYFSQVWARWCIHKIDDWEALPSARAR